MPIIYDMLSPRPPLTPFTNGSNLLNLLILKTPKSHQSFRGRTQLSSSSETSGSVHMRLIGCQIGVYSLRNTSPFTAPHRREPSQAGMLTLHPWISVTMLQVSPGRNSGGWTLLYCPRDIWKVCAICIHSARS